MDARAAFRARVKTLQRKQLVDDLETRDLTFAPTLNKKSLHMTAKARAEAELDERERQIRAELRRNELYLERVGREIEKKAAVFEREGAARKDAVKAYDALALKHHALERERDGARAERDACRARAASAEAEREALEATRRDLAAQVRALLKAGPKKAGKNAAGGDAEEHLVAFADVDELQLRNEQLLRVVRSLSQDVEAAKDQGDSGVLAATLAELEALKEEQK